MLVAARRSCATDPGAATEAAQAAALAQTGKYDSAIEHYQKAIRLDPHLPGIYLNLGLAYFKSNHLPEAAAAFEKAVAADPSGFQARTLLGLSYYGSGRYDVAAKELTVAAGAQPENLELRFRLAQSYLWSRKSSLP